jgi:hypothetical protein
VEGWRGGWGGDEREGVKTRGGCFKEIELGRLI